MPDQATSQQPDVEMEDIPELPHDTHDPGEYKHSKFWLDVAHEAIMVDHVAKSKRWQWGATKFAATGNVEDLVDPAEGDDMGVVVGNQVHVHVAKKQAEEMGVIEPESPSEGGSQVSGQGGGQATGDGLLKKLMKSLLPMLLAGGIGAGAGAYLFKADYEILFFDRKGNPVDVPRLPPELRERAQ